MNIEKVNYALQSMRFAQETIVAEITEAMKENEALKADVASLTANKEVLRARIEELTASAEA